jgi:hypothetical protein
LSRRGEKLNLNLLKAGNLSKGDTLRIPCIKILSNTVGSQDSGSQNVSSFGIMVYKLGQTLRSTAPATVRDGWKKNLTSLFFIYTHKILVFKIAVVLKSGLCGVVLGTGFYIQSLSFRNTKISTQAQFQHKSGFKYKSFKSV